MPSVQAIDLSKDYVSVKKQPGIKGAIKGLFSREKLITHAAQKINFEVEQGEIVGFLGPNGAGKTTTIKMLTGILHPTSGQASVLGYRPYDRRPEMLRQISLVMGNKMQLWWDLPAWESFLVLKELYDVPSAAFKERTEFLLETLGITDKMNVQVRRMSLGERMKCELVAALLHQPKVIFLDEPTIGLDVVSQKRIRDFLRDLNEKEGSTIILTSHYMQDIQELCERVIVIDHGRIIFDGKLVALSAKYAEKRRLRLSFEGEVPDDGLTKYGVVIESAEGSAVLEIERDQTAAVVGAVLAALPVNDVAIEEVSVEEVVRNLFESGRPSV